MRLLIVDPPGHGLDLAIRAQEAGHAVKLAIKDDVKTREIGRGFCDVVRNHRDWLRWADLTVCTDNSLYLHDLHRHRLEGGIVIAPSPDVAEWELDRRKGQEVFANAGIDVLPAVEFSDYDTAIEHVKNTMGRFVSKPCNDAEADKALSYCSSGPDDLIYMLNRWKKSDKLKGSFILQEFKQGIEMGVSAWHGPNGFTEAIEENFEFKKLLNGDIGCATGEQGTVLRYVRNSKLARQVLFPLAPQLLAEGYVGDVDVNCIIDENGKAWPLEFTLRLGWPAFQLQCALLKGDPVEWLYDLARGEDSRPFFLDRICVGVVLSTPDYPYSHMTRKEVCGTPLFGLTPGLMRHLHPCEMQLGHAECLVGDKLMDMPCPQTAGDYVLVMTATGETVQDCRTKVYRRLERVRSRMPGSPMYRTDIGLRLSRQLPELQRLGYARNLIFSTPPPS